jgi:hypothetical protein
MEFRRGKDQDCQRLNPAMREKRRQRLEATARKRKNNSRNSPILRLRKAIRSIPQNANMKTTTPQFIHVGFSFTGIPPIDALEFVFRDAID